MSFADELTNIARGRRRVKRPEIWRAFQRALPVEAAAGDSRHRLMVRLYELRDDGRIELPSETGRSWDRSARPPLPDWIAIPRPKEPAPAVDVASVPWAPELAFVATTPGLKHLEDALAIHEFLSNGGRARPMVPMRERSVELFGREKRLERLVRTPLFEADRLTLKTLRCFAMAPPLAFEIGPTGSVGQPCLVVENHHTWWSFCRWNERTGDYSAVVYGAGGGFGRDAVGFLTERCAEWRTSTAEYFGDVDPDGLTIPWRAATKFSWDDSFRLVPALRWYRLLIRLAETASLPNGSAIDVKEEVLDWLPQDVRSSVVASLARGVRIPQELVGTEVLAVEQSGRPDPCVPF